MSPSRIKIAVLAAFAACIFLIVLLFLQKRNLESMIREGTTDSLALQPEWADRMIRMDSLLLAGDYDAAIETGSDLLGEADSLIHNQIGLKMELATRLKASRVTGQEVLIDSKKYVLLDSTIIRSLEPREVRQHDSLMFALRKAQTQLQRLKNQSSRRAYGEYLSFTSEKGNAVHYVGQVLDGKANGTGVGLLDTGSRYVGEWKDNKKHGKGTFHWIDGESYEGGYYNDKRHGYGIYYWPNGEKYVGNWAENERNGQGVFFGEDGQIVAQGIWKNDELVEVEKRK